MSALTKNERDGLDEVFLSLHPDAKKYQKFKELSAFIIHNNPPIFFMKMLKRSKYGLKEAKISYFSPKFYKKKKNLSK